MFAINKKKRRFVELNWPLIEAKMKTKRFTQISLATAMGVSRATISGWKSNAYSPTDERLEDLCRLLDIDDSEIFMPLTETPSQMANINARSELLSVMLALSKLEDVIASDKSHLFLSAEDGKVLLSKAGDLRRTVFKIYSKKEIEGVEES